MSSDVALVSVTYFLEIELMESTGNVEKWKFCRS